MIVPSSGSIGGHLVDLSGRGHVDTTLSLSRTLYEALGLLGVGNDDVEQTILERDDRDIQPKKVRAAAKASHAKGGPRS